MTTLEILIAARALIAEPERWTKGVAALDAGGNETRCRGPRAVSWCAIGAIARVEDDPLVTIDAQVALQRQCGYGVGRFNDDPETTHADVLAMFDRAIAAERERGE